MNPLFLNKNGNDFGRIALAQLSIGFPFAVPKVGPFSEEPGVLLKGMQWYAYTALLGSHPEIITLARRKQSW